MKSELIKFFAVQRQIFGVCSCCGVIFRLSDTNVYTKKKPVPDWMDKIERSNARLDKAEEKIDSEEGEIREIARQKGRVAAMKTTKKIDTVFYPNKYSPDDAKVMFHPVDFVIFKGMKNGDVTNLILFDRKVKGRDEKAVQKSIEKTVSRENYEWVTVHVSEDGSVEYR